MCGFVALLQDDKSQNIAIWHLTDVMERRGPDDCGWLSYSEDKIRRGRERLSVSGRVILAHRRLSVIDLSEGGWQPMVSASGRYVISYNGEVYNYLELKKELQTKGHIFTSESDTEVILVAWQEWGKECVKRFKGMFAFTLLDVEEKRLFVARDPFGIKPAYYCKWDNGWGFGSTLKSLKLLPGVSSNKNPQKVYEYLKYGKSDRGKATIYEDIKQVLPGTILEFDIKSVEMIEEHKFWQLSPKIDTRISFDDAVVKTRELFLNSIELHMRSDVRVGSALSGGIDSSAIVCAIRHLYPETDIHTFTFVSEDEARSEEKWADIVNKHTNAIAHKIKPVASDFLNDIDDLHNAQEEPFGSTSIYAQYKVFEAAKKAGIKVMLDGQGADEMLGGYIYYQGARLATLIRQGNFKAAWKFHNNSTALPERNINLLFKMAGYLFPENITSIVKKIRSKKTYPTWLKDDWLKSNNIKDGMDRMRRVKGLGFLTSDLIDSLQRLAHLLRYEDRNSMYHSIESRVPFLLPEFAEFLLGLPESYLISDQGVSKYVFREAMRGIVPDEILTRQDKIGFESPQNIWLSQLTPWISDRFEKHEHSDAINIGHINNDLGKLHSYKSFADSNHIWRAICFMWYCEHD